MILFYRITRLLSVIVVIIFHSSCQGDQKVVNSNIKYNPGHYVAVGPFFNLSEIKYLDDTELKGINKRYFWRTLEPEQDEYDLTFIEEDLDYCSKHNKQLIVFLCDRAFWKKGAVPTYLKEHEWKNEGGGFSPIRWNQEYLRTIYCYGTSNFRTI